MSIYLYSEREREILNLQNVELNLPPWVWAELNDLVQKLEHRKEKNSNFIVEKLGKYYLKQVIKFDITGDVILMTHAY